MKRRNVRIWTLLGLCVGVISIITLACNNVEPVDSEDLGGRWSAAKWYSKCLNRLKEPTLKGMRGEVYRILILPTHGNATAVRVRKDGKLFVGVASRLDGKAGYEPGKLVERTRFTLSEGETKQLDALLVSSDFSSLATNEEPKNLGLDGDMWILEGTVDGHYHIVNRWSPVLGYSDERELDPFISLVRFLFEVSKLSEQPNDAGYDVLTRVPRDKATPDIIGQP